MVRKIVRYFSIFLLSVVVVLIVFLAASLAPVDRSLPAEHAYYNEMLSSIKPQQIIDGKYLKVGWAKENFTPSHPTSLAGYGNRWGKRYDTVHDSIYIRAMVIDNGRFKAAIVTADLLLIPPTVRQRLEEILPEIGFSLDNTYLGATHTHNSIGNWGEGAARFIYGPFEDSVVTFIANKIKTCIANADADLLPASIAHGTLPVGAPVRNRLVKDGPVDSLLRVVEVVRDDSTRLLMMSYTAHATCLYSKDLGLSRDYPGRLVDEIEAKGYDFAMFLAGSVGSHGCNPPDYGEACVSWMADHITDDFEDTHPKLQPLNDSSLAMYRLPLNMGTAQMKIARNVRVREWLFYLALGKYQPYISALRFGDVVLLSTPCDFSGEFNHAIDSVGQQHGLSTIVTSFNGAYIGYVTPLKYYDEDHSETRLMNWYGPGTGEYLLVCLEKMIEAVDND